MSTQMSSNRMYVIFGPVIGSMCLQVGKEENINLWHYRYAYLSFKGLNPLVKKDMVKWLPTFKEEEN